MQIESIKSGDNVVVVDDVLATGMQCSVLFNTFSTLLPGGSAKAAGELVNKLGGKTLEYLFIVEISFLKGASNLDSPVYSVTQVHE